MFRYGIAPSSSTTAGIIHPEDLQPNEGINKRKSIVPPLVSKTVPFARRGGRGTRQTGMGRAGHVDHHTVNSDVPAPRTQHAIRGKPWGGNGRHETPNPSRNTNNKPLPGTQRHSGPSTANITPFPMVSTKVILSPTPIQTKKASPSKHIHPLPRRPQDTGTPPSLSAYRPPSKTANVPVDHSSLSPPFTVKIESPNASLLHKPSPTVIGTRNTPPPHKRRKMNPPPTFGSMPIKSEDNGDAILRPSSQMELADTKIQPSIPLPKRKPRPSPPKPSAASPEPIVKQEPQNLTINHSPVERKLVQESCSFFPMPENCRKSHPNSHQNRRDFFRSEYRTLSNFGLTKTRAFFRDDGMVIEWKSPVPVWSDSLLPEVHDLASVIVRAHEANKVSSGDTSKRSRTDSMSSSSKKLRSSASQGDYRSSIGGRPSNLSKAPPPLSRVHSTSITSTTSIPQPGPTQPSQSISQHPSYPRHTLTTTYSSNPSFNPSALTSGPTPRNATTHFSTPTITTARFLKQDESYARILSADPAYRSLYSPDEDDKETSIVAEHLLRYSDENTQEDVEALAIEYLRRYIEIFDGDRTLLDAAYAEQAVFSCSVHHPLHPPTSSSMAGLFALPEEHSHSTHSRCPTLWQGRSDIVDKISLLGPYQFCPRGQQANLHYDVVSLGSLEIDGLLLKVHGELVNPHPAGAQLDHVVTLDQSFVLKHPSPVEIGRKIPFFNPSGGSPWPLVAVSHQMVVRDAPLLSPSKMVELLPWLSSFLL